MEPSPAADATTLTKETNGRLTLAVAEFSEAIADIPNEYQTCSQSNEQVIQKINNRLMV
ncbi:hypothetical protein [Mucilaginibacter agri]|uniref:Uncharacterized protein n=1 Tax=Mucilaginibacter agri TaxID=2695265 RepID=A0A966DQU1_9SPHI|nr:hypothetical protein [Mucilaginibacter agri]NCD68348.1 hypothetical protein [Mucilaginibacter agri]